MAMSFASIDEIIAEFQLTRAPSDLQGIKTDLEARRRALHPNGPEGSVGKFADGQAEATYHRIDAALRFTRKANLLPTTIDVNQLPALLEAYAQSGRHSDADEKLTAEIKRWTARERIRHALPRATSATLAAICSVLFTLSMNGQTAQFLAEFVLEDEPPISASRSVGVARRAIFVLRDVRRDENFKLGGEDDEFVPFKRAVEYLREDLEAAGYADAGRSSSTLDAAQAQAMLGEFVGALNDISSESSQLGSIRIEARDVLHELRRERRVWERERLKSAAKWRARFGILLPSLTGIFSLAWLLIWTRERSDARWVERLAQRSGQAEIIRRLQRHTQRMAMPTTEVTWAQIKAAVALKGGPALRGRLLGSRISDPERVTERVIECLIDREWLERLDSTRMDERFRITVPLADEASAHHEPL